MPFPSEQALVKALLDLFTTAQDQSSGSIKTLVKITGPSGNVADVTTLGLKTDPATLLAGEDQPNNVMRTAPKDGWALTAGTVAANTQATVTKAAGAAGFKHVLTSLTAALVGGATAPAAVQLWVYVRDGAAGAGTILWAAPLALPATAGGTADTIQLSGLWIVGSAATAMTIEFSAAGGANTVEGISGTGVDIQ